MAGEGWRFTSLRSGSGVCPGRAGASVRFCHTLSAATRSRYLDALVDDIPVALLTVNSDG
jgi:hypothetical protein